MKKIPISAGRELLKKFDLSQVIIIARDNDGFDHVVTYGKNKAECREAGLSGDNLKRFMGWPISTLSKYSKESDGSQKPA